MRRSIARPLITVLAMCCAAPFAANDVVANDFDQVWTCELNSGKSLDEARAVAAEWLKAARSMEHGETLQAYIHYPIIVNDSGSRFHFVVRATSLAEWGAFYDRYDDGTPVAAADVKFAEVASCSGSTMWEAIKVE